jgi:hypothetical protein
MNPSIFRARDLFDAAVRIAGVVVVLWGLWNLLDIVATIPELFTDSENMSDHIVYILASLIYGVPGCFFGTALIVWGGWITRLAYPESSKPTPPSLPSP